MKRFIRNALRSLVVTAFIALSTAAQLHAQSATPEGTVIQNIATLTFTDANGNSYAAVADTVDVTVGFAAGVDVTGSTSASPSPGSTGNTLTYQIHNVGNGTDSVTVSTSATLVTITGYVYSATSYPTLAALNTALAIAVITQGDSLAVDVVYDVPAGSGGQSGDVTLTATSRRDVGTSDLLITTINVTETIAVAVTPDGGQNLQQLPNSGGVPTYSQDLVVQNNGDGPEDFDLVASSVNPAVITSIVSVNGVAGTSTTITNVAAGASVTVPVVYVVGNSPGAADTLYLAATSVSNSAVSDSGFVDLTVVVPGFTVAKAVFRDDASTPIISTDRVVPGEFIRYRITVTNTGSADADNVHVDDTLPGELTHIANLDPGGFGWTFSSDGVSDVDADYPGQLGSGASAEFWIRAQVN